MSESIASDCLAVYPTLEVVNVAQTVQFYCQALRFEQRFLWGEPPTHAGVSWGQATVHFSAGEPGPAGMWIYFHVEDVDDLWAQYSSSRVEVMGEPMSQPWGMREFEVRDINGYLLRFGQSDLRWGEPVPIQRVEMSVRLEKRLAALLADLANHKQMTLEETLEETVLHSFEPLAGHEGSGVASPHTKRTLRFIEELKRKHGVDYDTHDSYRFRESPP